MMGFSPSVSNINYPSLMENTGATNFPRLQDIIERLTKNSAPKLYDLPQTENSVSISLKPLEWQPIDFMLPITITALREKNKKALRLIRSLLSEDDSNKNEDEAIYKELKDSLEAARGKNYHP